MDVSENSKRYLHERQRRGERTPSYNRNAERNGRKETDDALGSLRSPLRSKYERSDDCGRYEADNQHETPKCRQRNYANRSSWRYRPSKVEFPSPATKKDLEISLDDFPKLEEINDRRGGNKKPVAEVKPINIKKAPVAVKKDWATLVEEAELDALGESLMTLSSEDEESISILATPSSGIGSSIGSDSACRSSNHKSEKIEIFHDEQQTRSKRRLDLSRCSSSSSGIEDQENRVSKREYERDELVLARRQKTIDYGKNTPEYARYLKEIPLVKRKKNEDPVTPKKHIKYSRRSWDAQIKLWRLKLHKWDPPTILKKHITDNGPADDDEINLDDLNVDFFIEFEDDSLLDNKENVIQIRSDPNFVEQI